MGAKLYSNVPNIATVDMKIWVDADACPSAVRDIVIRAAHRKSVEAVFVANRVLSLPESAMLTFVQVDSSPDAADRLIGDQAQPGDLVVTQDIPLAHALVHKQVIAINPRGETYTEDNVGDRLAIRNLMQDMRDGGEITGGPKQYSASDRRAFAAAFDRELVRLMKQV